VHESSGLFTRFEVERNGLNEKISDLRAVLDNLAKKDEYLAQRENQMFRKIIFSIPDFQVLQVIQSLRNTSYSHLVEITGLKRSELRKITKSLNEHGYLEIDKSKRPHVITFIFAPWQPNNEFHDSRTAISMNDKCEKPTESLF
jgi:hypothetical protein